MSRDSAGKDRDSAGHAIDVVPAASDRGWGQGSPVVPEGRPRLRVQFMERTALVQLMDASILFEEPAVRRVIDQIGNLVERGHTRLLLNLSGVEYMSGALLGWLAGLQTKIEPEGGRIRLCGLCPLLQDMLRITNLDRVFDSYTDETEALGLPQG